MLRRNRVAAESSILPHAAYKDMIGPDLVRELNALHIPMGLTNPNPSTLTRLDRELISVISTQLDVARAVVAALWSGSLSECAALFLDHDNVPAPFCPMYPNARDCIPSSHAMLPHSLTKIVERLRHEIERTESMQQSLTLSSQFTPSFLQKLATMKEQFAHKAVYRQGETIGDWQKRIHRLIDEGRSIVPPSLVQLNRLIHISVLCVVSLAVWDYKITTDDVLSCAPWGAGKSPRSSSAVAATNEQPAATEDTGLSYGPAIPNGYELRIGTTGLILLPFDTCIQLHENGKLRGIALVIGASLCFDRDEGYDSRLRIVEFSSYENWDMMRDDT